ncbi:hypothetical protein DY000_02005337 [Brassica cretica]|uniref:Transposase-associated domain-containing protein n=1 Tax=Brassica cretica TaxID=69181 RepID=A0ABQ7BSN2_BRACR|nr:hypothetical protein DY000_02005337 [Brassica cretica]
MLKGFTENYYLWTHHGENWQYNDGEVSRSHHVMEHEQWGDYSNNVPMENQYHDSNTDFNMLPDDATFLENVQEPAYEENHDAVFQALDAGCTDRNFSTVLGLKSDEMENQF